MDSIPQRRCSRCNQEFPATLEYFYQTKNTKLGLSRRCKQCVKEAKKESRAANPSYAKEEYWRDVERSREKGRKTYWKDPEKSRQAKRDYRVAHPNTFRDWAARNAESLAKKKRQWRLDNPDKVKKHKSDSQKRNRPAANLRTKKWAEKNPEKVRAQTLTHKSRQNGAPGRITGDDRKWLHEDQEGRCFYCGITLYPSIARDCHVDHIVPPKDGGTNQRDNLVMACGYCNNSKNDLPLDEWMHKRGW